MDETIKVKARPGSIKNEIISFDAAKKSYVINIAAVADKGKANKELLKFLKRETGKSWRIKSGSRSREKILYMRNS